MTFKPNQTVYCRFTREAFTVVSCNGCVATLRDANGDTTGRIVGELTSEPRLRRDDESPSEYAERVDAALATSGRYFADATKAQTATYNERMSVNRAYIGAPKWQRQRDAIDREFTRTTEAAAELCNLTFAELMTTGEVSEALSYRWDALDLPSYDEALTDAAKARKLFDASKGGNVRGITEDHRYQLAEVIWAAERDYTAVTAAVAGAMQQAAE